MILRFVAIVTDSTHDVNLASLSPLTVLAPRRMVGSSDPGERMMDDVIHNTLETTSAASHRGCGP
jgi:hypothetical protein